MLPYMNVYDSFNYYQATVVSFSVILLRLHEKSYLSSTNFLLPGVRVNTNMLDTSATGVRDPGVILDTVPRVCQPTLELDRQSSVTCQGIRRHSWF